MKKVRLASVVCGTLILVQNAFCQIGPNFARMRAVNTRGAIFITEIDTKSPKYFTSQDVKAGEDSYLESGMYFWAKSKQNKVTLFLPFYNPLKNKISSHSKNVDNPSIVVIDTLISSLGSVFTTVLPSNSITYLNLKAPDLKQAGNTIERKYIIDEYGSDISLLPGAIESRIKTVTLKDWVYQIIQQETYSKVLDDSLVNMISKVENFLYYKISLDKQSDQVEQLIKDIMKPVYDATSLDAYEKAINKASLNRDQLKVIYDKTKLAYDNLLKTIENPGIDLSSALELYSKNTATDFKNRIGPLLTKKKEAIEGLSKFIEINSNMQKEYQNKQKAVVNEQPYFLFQEYDFKDIDKDLILTITHRKISDGTIAKDSLSSSFTIIHGRPAFTPFVSPGLAYFPSDVTFLSYTLDNNIITKSISTKTVLPTLYINFYSKLGQNWYLILPQIGIGAGKELPMILAGAGFAFGNRFILTAGIPFYWSQELKGKTEGDSSNEDDFKDALKFKASDNYPLYLSVSIKLGKK